MPMILMTVRFEVEMIFRVNYIKFFKNIGNSGKPELQESNEEPIVTKKALRLM